MKIYFILLLFLSFPILSQDLPNYLTDYEKTLLKTYISPFSEKGFTTPPIKPVRTVAEWEEMQGILITWTSYTTILRQIVDYAQEEGQVYIVCSDSNTVKSNLLSVGVPIKNIKFIIANYNSIWSRDYGPWSVYSDDIDSLYIVDWIYNRPRPSDDLIPSVFAINQSLPLYQTTVSPNNFINTGGNFMTDGHGTGFASKLVLTENPTKTESQINSIMNSFMGINRYIKMETLPYDDIHHIDMHMKLIDEETILVGQYPTGISDGPQIEANIQYIQSNFLNCYGRPYKIVRIPMPPDGNYYPSSGGDYRTYTNSLIINKTVIVPTYELKYDTTALRIYREAMPGYNVVGIDCNQIIPSLGAIHCITKEIGTKEPILISHAKINETDLTYSGYLVKANIQTKSGISNAQILWKTDLESEFHSINMINSSADSFYAYIPQQEQGRKVHYYISAMANSSKIISKPLTAPNGYYSFDVNIPLPVQLISFNYTISDNNLLLHWKTITETNNKEFELFFRNRNELGNEILVARIPGAGTSSIPNEYNYASLNNTANSGTYRLYQVDYSGERTLIGNLEIETANSKINYSLAQNYPNPFNPTTKISFSIPEKQNVNISIHNILGENILTLIDKEFEAGFHSIDFNPTLKGLKLSSGVYLYSFKTNTYFETKKLIYQK